MQSRARLGLSLLPLLAALLVPACKTVDKDESVPVPSAAPSASTTADPLATATATAAPPPVAPPPAAPTPKLDAGAPHDAGTVGVDAGKVVDAGGAANGTLKACSEKCQAVLQGCAIPQISTDGGLPKLKDPVACQAAANACFAACTP
jgi:hypothetical protein